MRVVSLLPSATEIVCALGQRDVLVGRSHECDHPGGVETLPAVSLARIDSEALSSAEIDAEVRRSLERGEQLYRVDEGQLAELRPDLVITQTLCRVCAVEGDGVRSALRVRAVKAEVVELEPGTIGQVLGSIEQVAGLVGVPERGREVAAGLRERLARVEAALAGVAERPRTFVAEWLAPPFAAGHWVPEMVERGGGVEILGRTGEPSFSTTWDEVRARTPEVAILAPCGFDVERTLAEAAAERTAAELAGTPAAASGRIYAVDATSYYSRPGPRVVDGVELTAALLHPERCGGLAPAGSWRHLRAR
jgi:iron complex transport system substrate-binding protein